jgi:hypothetical protein
MISKDQQNVFLGQLRLVFSGLDTDFEHDWLRLEMAENGETKDWFREIGLMPMPIDLLVGILRNYGKFYIPLRQCITKSQCLR